MKRVILSLLGVVTCIIPQQSQAQTRPITRVPMCLQYPDTKTYVPCTGVVPVDHVTGEPFSWSSVLGGGSGGTATPKVTLIDGSGRVTAAGVSQTVFAANTNRATIACQNPSSETEALYLNIDGSADDEGGSYEILPGVLFTGPQGVRMIGPINITAATTGHRFTCKQGLTQ